MSPAPKKPRRKDKVPMPEQAPEVRAKNFLEVPLGYDAEMAVEEAERCLQCKVPACVCGCPVNINIPGFIQLITERKFAEAARKIKETNALPAVCGRVCPQESQCEAQCVLNKMGRAVAIGRLERFAADFEREHELVQIPPKAALNGKKIAVVGSGPSGLTVAGDMILLGYDVTIFEAFHKPGGVLMYGIPEFRLPKDIVEKEVDYLVKLGVNLKLNEIVGKTVTIDELLTEKGFHAVFIGVGAGLPKFLGIPGENLGGMYSANEYLTRSNLMKAYRFPEYDTPIVRGKKVCVIGGGNVAMDSARTALRLGGDVSIVYRRAREQMPARAEEIHHAEEEGVKLCLLTNPVEILGDENNMVNGLKCSRMELGEPDESGRSKPILIPNSEYVIESDLVINAIGAGANPLLTTSTPGLELNKWGYITADEWGKTSKEGVWAGGDIVTGMATVIEAMGAGRKSAMDIHEKLMGVKKAIASPEALPDDMTCKL
ncbi:MAG: NADPH-dependent glutamate synthase [Candidatus Thermoplasmatota archaeon]|nr:NADPH-dependent glutamate synthase [Euryarchaeota archaeon]MBU4031484.1 NADPH-dependent glutamate synthase [Candidatus Thermoplasmatota archaeon]MBU4070901.1 NADPH-dependent glutamate synthase [Candidatus Thermoplasmatota archaeon]MBU4143732.1 NADPH-dependent glutamate synthase [Candidatus Thermoplasmatota archaeon]MBU4592415.1 NADPH-dependent glutamate synthase [Candidatus Thermoplasmatota archaeon]